ncbi:MAG: class I SAM-dependent methyltransferase [Magnetococcales bacterium]|nr:class I SAM-dependent methyltransferase [Magnetococcales bacterium]
MSTERKLGYKQEKCPGCLSKNIIKYFDYDSFNIMSCIECKTAFVYNIPSEKEIFNFYKSSYTTNGDFIPNQNIFRILKYRLLGKYLISKARNNNGIRLLEIGCSQGYLMHALQGNKNIYTEGIDYAEGPISYATSQGLNAFNCSIWERGYKDGDFQIIAALHVVEHFQDLTDHLNEIHRILSIGGIFYSVIPCISHIKAKLAGKKWKYFGPPGHLWYFSALGYLRLLERHNFHIENSSLLSNRSHLRVIARKIY